MDGFTRSGKIGVALLFLLSGYLMASLYPQVPSVLAFWQKRYTRIFPAFVTMCFILALVRFFSWKTWPSPLILALALIIMVGIGVAWRLVQRSVFREQLGKFIFRTFLAIQALAVLGYVFILPRVPSAVFYERWPAWGRQVVVFVMNATLALPFGNYVGQLDGVYWSIITEVFFYLLYPLLFLPLVSFIVHHRSRAIQVLSFALLFPFFYGLDSIFKNVLGFYIMEVHFAITFVLGIVIGLTQQSEPAQRFHQFIHRIPGPVLLVGCLAMIIGNPMLLSVWRMDHVTEGLVWSIPLALVLAITLISDHWWSRFLSQRWLILLGQVSFSLYLTHTLAIEVWTRFQPIQTLTQTVVVSVISLLTTAVLTAGLHYFLEQPYFHHAKSTKTVATTAKKKSRPTLAPLRSLSWRTLLVVMGSIIACVWFAYRIPVAPTAFTTNHFIPSIPSEVILDEKPLALTFQATQDNLGMLLFSIDPLTNEEIAAQQLSRGDNAEYYLMIEIFDDQHHLITSNQYALYQIFESRFHPAGMPLQSNSAGKTYTAELRMSGARTVQMLKLRNDEATLRSDYLLNKKELIKNPQLFIAFLGNKLWQPLAERGAFPALLLTLPLLIAVGIAKIKQPSIST
jgi:peptidoglycan/LPS O-acetylase OafA/YrhL